MSYVTDLIYQKPRVPRVAHIVCDQGNDPATMRGVDGQYKRENTRLREVRWYEESSDNAAIERAKKDGLVKPFLVDTLV